MTRTASYPETLDLTRVLTVLGPAAAVSYAPPNIYPMSAPRFTAGSRNRPDGRVVSIFLRIDSHAHESNARPIGRNLRIGDPHKVEQIFFGDIAFLS